MTTTQRIIDSAVALVDAESAVREAKANYQDAQLEYRRNHGWIDGPIDPDDERHAGFIDATAATYEATQKAKRHAYNKRRTLRTAVAAHKLALINQEAQTCE